MALARHLYEIVAAVLGRKPMPEGWRTTLSGLVLWSVALVLFGRFVNGNATAGEFLAAIAAASGGSGLISAQDAKW